MMREKQRTREADISKVGALGEHLIIIYIRFVSPSPQNGQIQQGEMESKRDTDSESQMLIHTYKQ